MIARARLVMAILLAPIVSGCVHACTLIPCLEGLIVRLPSPPAGPFMIEVLVPAGQTLTPIHTYECPTGTCPDQVWIQNVELTHIVVRVTTQAGVRTTDVPQVPYEMKYPNGTDCDTGCLNAVVTAELPE